MAIAAQIVTVGNTDPVFDMPNIHFTDTVNPAVGARAHAEDANRQSAEIAALAEMTYSNLHLAWRRHYRSTPPKKLSRDILELGIAWKIQETGLGGLGVAVKRQISDLANTMVTKSGLVKARSASLKPGARLLRAWRGVTHEVMVVEEGFIWAGKTWRSLSVIAREMTGTRWSGPRFFGLRCTTEPDISGGTAKVSGHE